MHEKPEPACAGSGRTALGLCHQSVGSFGSMSAFGETFTGAVARSLPALKLAETSSSVEMKTLISVRQAAGISGIVAARAIRIGRTASNTVTRRSVAVADVCTAPSDVNETMSNCFT